MEGGAFNDMGGLQGQLDFLQGQTVFLEEENQRNSQRYENDRKNWEVQIGHLKEYLREKLGADMFSLAEELQCERAKNNQLERSLYESREQNRLLKDELERTMGELSAKDKQLAELSTKRSPHVRKKQSAGKQPLNVSSKISSLQKELAQLYSRCTSLLPTSQ